MAPNPSLVSPGTLAERLTAVETRIGDACARAGRQRGEVVLLAVTKVFPADIVRQAYELGLRDFGESYVQEFEAKSPQLAALSAARFHLIGHLQSNKARRAAELFSTIQTVDTSKLAQRLDEAGKRLDVLIEVKLSAEQAKQGCAPEDLPALVETVRSLPNLNLRGLLTMPPWSDDAEVSRPYFSQLRALAARHGLAQLSMGMSHDLEVAIAEGATIVRIGTALFGRRKKA